MALHLERFAVSGAKALIFEIHRNQLGNRLVVASTSIGSILAMTAMKGRKRIVSSRTVVLGFVLIIALALLTGSVLLIGYVAAAA